MVCLFAARGDLAMQRRRRHNNGLPAANGRRDLLDVIRAKARLSPDSSWVSSRCLSFPSAASESAIGNSTLHSAKTSNTTSSAGIHNVLGPNGTSVDVAGKRAERRSPKTCLQESKTWNQLAPCGLRPGPLAFQLHGNHPAYRRGFGADSQPCKLLRYHE